MRWACRCCSVVLHADERRRCARSSRVVLIPRRWYHACCDAHASRRQRWPKSPAHRGEREAAVPTIARGMPDVSAEPVVPAACLFVAGGPWVRPAPGIPRALFVPRAGPLAKLGRKTRRENAASCLAPSSCPRIVRSGLFSSQLKRQHLSSATALPRPCRTCGAIRMMRQHRRRWWSVKKSASMRVETALCCASGAAHRP
jgi:hypothetical protein